MLRFLDNHINPLLLRELRQQVRNRFIIVLINLYIAVLVLVCLMNVLFQDYSQIGGLGNSLFIALAVVMGFACFLAVVVYTATTTASERINGDLMFTSALKPSTIVFGKALAGAVLTVLLMSITAPFVMLAYLLRGLDIEIVAITFLSIFAGIQVLCGMAICIFSNIRTKAQMAAILGGGFFVLWFGIAALSGFLSMYFRFSSGSADIWSLFAGQLLTAGAFLAFFLSGAVRSIAPPASNRMLPIRLTITAIYFGSLLVCVIFPPFSFISNAIVLWVYSWIGVLSILIFTVICEQDIWSVRIKRTIPKNFIFRAVLFPFYTGSPNGFVWIILLGLGINLTIIYADGFSEDIYNSRVFYWFLFSFDYCATALLIRTYFVPKKITPEKTWMIVMILLLVFIPCGMLAAFLPFNNSSDFTDVYEESVLSALNLFLLKEPISDSVIQTTAAQFWGFAVLLPFLVWFLTRTLRFSPQGNGETMTLEQAVAAVREADIHPLVQSDKERKRKELEGSIGI